MTLQPIVQPGVVAARRTVRSADQDLRVTEESGLIRVTADRIRLGTERIDVAVRLEFRRRGDGFEVTGEIAHEAKGWLVRDFRCPMLERIDAPAEKFPLLWPNGLGQRFTTGKAVGDRTFNYPSGSGTMPWVAWAGEDAGLYIGVHDEARGGKDIRVRYDEASRTFDYSALHPVFCAPGGRWRLPATVMLPYSGSWHAAARHYRGWHDAVFTVRAGPAWARENAGWVLGILKQQNDLVMWDYSSLVQLGEVAAARGLNVLGLFGWAHGGHDKLYPDYFPDPKMGGAEELRRALAELRRRGQRTILYANGQLMDTHTEEFRARWKAVAVQQENGELAGQTWQKYKSFPAVRHALACQRSEEWQQRMLELARQAHMLGADGILYDQLGVGGHRACWAPQHGHPVPASGFAGERAAWLRRIADEMTRVAPDFIVMTEGVHDTLLDSVPYFHGWGRAMFTQPEKELLPRVHGSGEDAVFPEMFRYTFPEVAITQRQPTPMLSRFAANYALLFGLRFEIESRYAPDVRYLHIGTMPGPEDYADVVSPPDVALMRATPAGDATRYLRAVADFTRRHAEFFWRGRFVDNEGFTLTGDGLIAKAYRTEKQLGVLIWNPTGAARTVRVDVPGARLVSTSEPESAAADPASPLGARSVRLCVWNL
jgi:hypothetical protein